MKKLLVILILSFLMAFPVWNQTNNDYHELAKQQEEFNKLSPKNPPQWYINAYNKGPAYMWSTYHYPQIESLLKLRFICMDYTNILYEKDEIINNIEKLYKKNEYKTYYGIAGQLSGVIDSSIDIDITIGVQLYINFLKYFFIYPGVLFKPYTNIGGGFSLGFGFYFK